MRTEQGGGCAQYRAGDEMVCMPGFYAATVLCTVLYIPFLLACWRICKCPWLAWLGLGVLGVVQVSPK